MFSAIYFTFMVRIGWREKERVKREIQRNSAKRNKEIELTNKELKILSKDR
jgi:hypothetical protein